MRKFLALNVGWVRCAFHRCVKLPLDYERTVTQQCSDSYLCITVLARFWCVRNGRIVPSHDAPQRHLALHRRLYAWTVLA